MGRGEDDYISEQFAKNAAKKFKKGKFTATQTGAKELAAKRYAFAQNREILNAAGAGTSDFEDRAIKKSPRPTRKKGY